jgi:hypothetical protein
MKGSLLVLDEIGRLTRSEHASALKLEHLKEAIGGGSIEVVPYFDTVQISGTPVRCVVFCDEEGKNKGQIENLRATALWETALQRQRLSLTGPEGMRDYLVGKIAIVIGDDEFLAAL